MGESVIIGIAGGSASGKSTFATNIASHFRNDEVIIIKQDSYYRPLEGLTLKEKAEYNFDHPDSVEFDLLFKHLKELTKGNPIDYPIYNFSTYTREEDFITVQPAKIIIVEGILVLAMEKLRKLFDVKIYIDTDADEMVLRRIERDTQKRSRTLESVINQYLKTVKPMYLQFTEPSKRYADVIIPHGGKNIVALNMVVAKLKKLLMIKHL